MEKEMMEMEMEKRREEEKRRRWRWRWKREEKRRGEDGDRARRKVLKKNEPMMTSRKTLSVVKKKRKLHNKISKCFSQSIFYTTFVVVL